MNTTKKLRSRLPLWIALLAQLSAPLFISRVVHSAPLADEQIHIGAIGTRRIFVAGRWPQVFTPMGVNYTRLDHNYHVTFDPGYYSSAQSQQALQNIARLNYNYVRVFVSTIHSNQGFGLSSPGVGSVFLSNLADFLLRARSLQLHVSLTGENIPENYRALTLTMGAPAHVSGDVNAKILHPGAIRSNGQFWQDLLVGLNRISPGILSVIFTIDINNEMAVDLSQEPFSLSTGLFTDAYGNHYNLGNDRDRQRLIDVNAVAWMNSVRRAIHQVDPNILVGTSLFTPAAVQRSFFTGARLANSPDVRLPLRLQSLDQNSEADYVDLHIYPRGAGWSISQDLASAELTASHFPRKPLIMGEFGMAKTSGNEDFAAAQLRDMLRKSCQYGFIGWSFWSWDTAEQKELWNLQENSSYLNRVLSPFALPDYCAL
jgi:hypothetical protein